MNISEIKKEKIEKNTDLLRLLFERQSEIEKKYCRIEGIPERLAFGKKEHLHVPEVCRHINDQILWRMVQEINEAVVALKNAKTWREQKYFTDIDEYLDEVADIFIYFMNLCLASGITPDELAQIVIKKMKVNSARIVTKY